MSLLFFLLSISTIILLFGFLLSKSVNRDYAAWWWQQQKPTPQYCPVSEEIAGKAKWIAEESANEIPNWNSVETIQIKFCTPESMYIPGKGEVLGYVDPYTPNTMFINTKFASQTWLLAKGIIHEVYHIYQNSVLKQYITDSASRTILEKSADEWSDEIMDKILFERYYKEKEKKNEEQYLLYSIKS